MLHSLTLDRLQDGAWEQDETLAKCVRMAHCALADAQHAQDTAVLAGGKVTSEAWANGAEASSRMTNNPAASSAAACVSPPNISPSAAGCCTGGERMLTPNASCTLYLQTGPGAYTRVYVPPLLLAGRRGRREHRHPR